MSTHRDEAGMPSRGVLIFRDVHFNFSETFIISQGEALSRFRATYVGSRKVSGISAPEGRSFLINDGSTAGRCREILFKVFNTVLPSHLKRFSSWRPSLVHAHFGPDGVLAQPIARALSVPLVVTFHGYDATTRDEFVRKSFFSHRKYLRNRGELIKNGARFIAVSHFVKKKLLEQGYPEEKVVVHYVGVDTGKFTPVPEVPRDPVVLFVGRLVEKKGCGYLIRAMGLVQRSFPEVELVVIGDGPLRKELEEEARTLPGRVRFLGAQPSHVVRDWLNRATVFSVPSITGEFGEAEGFGLVFAEAQSMGVPVVTFRTGGIPEAVSHCETGFLVPEKDWEGLAEQIGLLLADKVLWTQMSEAAQKRVRREFDLKRQLHLLEDLYLDILDATR